MRMQVCLLVVALLVGITEAKPGNEWVLDEKTFVAQVYLSKMVVKDGRVSGAELVLLPKKLVDACMGISYAEARKLRPPRSIFKARPTRALSTWISGKEAAALPMARAAAKGQPDGEHRSLLSAEQSCRAKVHWQRWTNGERFEIKEWK